MMEGDELFIWRVVKYSVRNPHVLALLVTYGGFSGTTAVGILPESPTVTRQLKSNTEASGLP